MQQVDGEHYVACHFPLVPVAEPVAVATPAAAPD
jgi:hypothetical protein